ncbi:hypothetical protein [Rhodopseudomonas palustris]|uniref:Uncharacterized protein n=1 Tax=Rhodopseudomonas palustris (strain BisB18) TaxID=316056 RepID=Q210J2_RHOPB
MANCTRCGHATTTMDVEHIDGVYELYSWSCSSCDHTVQMAMACSAVVELPDYCLFIEPADVATATAPLRAVGSDQAPRYAPRRVASA